MSPEPFVSRAKALPAKRSEKGYGDESERMLVSNFCLKLFLKAKIDFICFVVLSMLFHTFQDIVNMLYAHVRLMTAQNFQLSLYNRGVSCRKEGQKEIVLPWLVASSPLREEVSIPTPYQQDTVQYDNKVFHKLETENQYQQPCNNTRQQNIQKAQSYSSFCCYFFNE